MVTCTGGEVISKTKVTTPTGINLCLKNLIWLIQPIRPMHSVVLSDNSDPETRQNSTTYYELPLYEVTVLAPISF